MSDLNRTLSNAVTTFDRKQEERARKSKRGYHNRYALPQYLLRIDEICADVDRGATPRAAIIAAFDGRLRDACLRAIGESTDVTPDEEHGGLFYVPASDR